MTTLPRHLLLAAVLLTVCCAERQAVAAASSDKGVASLAEPQFQASHAERRVARRAVSQRSIRPAVTVWRDAAPQGFGFSSPLIRAQSSVVHATFPPARFRLPPPSCLL